MSRTYTDGTSTREVVDWRDEAACRSTQEDDGPAPDLFFPDGKTDGRVTTAIRQQVEAAKQVCWGECTVRAKCLLFALETRQAGIWGGYTEEERTSMIRAAARQARERRAQEVMAS